LSWNRNLLIALKLRKRYVFSQILHTLSQRLSYRKIHYRYKVIKPV